MTRRSDLTLDEILSIPGNGSVFNALTSTLRDLEAVAFVGAGASVGMYPLWEELIEKLANYAVAQGKAGAKDAVRWKMDKTSTPQQRVNVILRRLSEPLYRNFLKEVFGPREGPNGKRFTATHAALLRLRFRGYITTNYDPALEFARMELRRNSLTTGTPTWQDDDEVHRWYTGDIFKQEDDCPILWLHGFWQRPHTIILNSAEYADAYRPRLYRRLFEALWGQRHLIFIGFGFNDPQFTFMVGEYLRDIKDVNALPRHVAILGLPIKEDGASLDEEAIREWRDNLESDYNVRPLFYLVRNDNHSGLQTLLEAVAAACGYPVPIAPSESVPAVTPATNPLTSTFAAKWFHEPSNDDKFVGRNEEISRLDRWVRDEAVRAVGVSSVGGTGKTALVGHWLKNTAGWRSRPFTGLFAWSFYQDRDTRNFLHEFLLWGHETLSTSKPDKKSDLVNAALAMLRTRSIIIVMDGLEVLQEGPEDIRHGTFLDGDLRKFLSALCQREHRSLAVLTSRFVFADLERFLGTAFHQLELHGLPPEQGDKLLEELGIDCQASERAYISENLYGHPLGLRVFADALPDEYHDEPRRFLDFAFRPSELPEGAPLNDKLRRLLVFYEKKLPPVQARLLSVVALFRIPVGDEAVLRLTRGLFKEKENEQLPDSNSLTEALRRLQVRGILSREPIEGGLGNACHPILRDHFRAILLRTGINTARRTADLLKGQPSSEKPRNPKEIEPVLLAIELLIDAGEFRAADELYRSRLAGGEIFLTIPAPTEGLNCALGFVRDEVRKKQCEKDLSWRGLAFYLNEVGRHAMQSGHFELALRYYISAITVAREEYDASNLSLGLQNKAALLAILGRLAEVKRAVTEAIKFANKEDDGRKIVSSHSIRGWGATLLGNLYEAAEDLARADKMEKEADFEENELESLKNIHGAELLVRSGHPALAISRTQNNLRVCESYQWNYHVALCEWMLSWCALSEGSLDFAETQIRRAEPILHRAQLLFDLARLHITAGEISLARNDAAGALHRAAEALSLAAPRGMRLVHADALVLRGRARMLVGHPDNANRALDDAEAALRLARECGYAWAERDALFLKADALVTAAKQNVDNARAATRDGEASRRAREEAEALAARLVLTTKDLAAADVKAESWVRHWDREFE